MTIVACPPDQQASEDSSLWVGSGELSALAAISERNVNKALCKCHSGSTWRGYALKVRVVTSVGGNSGKSYQVSVASLPPDLRQAWQDRHPELFLPPGIQFVAPPIRIPETNDPKMADRWAEAQWRLEVLYPALLQRPRSPGRGEEIRGIVGRKHRHWAGEIVTVSRRWCEAMINRYETAERREKGSGIYALMRKARPDKGRTRVLVCTSWKAACPLSEEEKSQIAVELGAYIDSEWASGVPSWRRVAALASAKLLELSRAAGWAEATHEACQVGRYMAEKGRKYRVIAIHDQDAKRFHDNYQPRIQRKRDDLLPMDIIVGDVHPVDVLTYREDGSQATARAIAWLDIATNRVHVTLIQLRPREGVKQIHVTQAFIAMVRAWGLPRRLYLDNGKEYFGPLIDGFRMLAAMVTKLYGFHDFRAELFGRDELIEIVSDLEGYRGTGGDGCDPMKDRDSVIRARPYNAPAKHIEGIFGVLETSVFPMIPGYIGGNRMAKKTHNVGKAAKPFPGGFPAFHIALEKAIDFYHRQAQGVTSPFQRLEYFQEEQGWRAVKVPEVVMLFAFSSLDQIQVRNNGITLTKSGESRTYWHDDMIPLIQGKTSVRSAKHDPACIFFTNRDGKWIAASEGPRFYTLDTDGAKEKMRRTKLSNVFVNELRSNVARLDLVQEMDRFNAMTPNPETLFGPEISLTSEMQELADAREQIGKLPARAELPPGKVFDEVSGKVVDMYPPPPNDDADEDSSLPSEADFWRAAG